MQGGLLSYSLGLRVMPLALQARNMTVGEAQQLVERRRQELAEAEAVLESRQLEFAAAVVSLMSHATQVAECPSSRGLHAVGAVWRCRHVNSWCADATTCLPAALTSATLQ